MRSRAGFFAVLVAFGAAGCSDILGIPSEGKVGCPEPCTVTVSGRTVDAKSTSGLGVPGVTIRLTSVDPVRTVTSGDGGSFSFDKLPPGTPLQFDLSIPQSNPDPHGLDTQYLAGTTAMDDITLDLPIVQYQWLAQVAFQCGIFPTLNDALFEPGTMNANSYFAVRSTILGQVENADGTPAGTFDRADITVNLRSASSTADYLNFQGNPDSMTANGTTICLLEPDSDLGEFKGVNEEHAASGRFVMFRTRNDVGTGTGTGQVAIPAFPPGPLAVSSGAVGFAHIKLGDGTALPDRIHTFERDVYHWFKDETCSDICHKPGGIGFTTAPKRPGKGDPSTLYPADWSASVDDVFNNLTKPDDTNCEQGGASIARVCLAMPKASLLYINPTSMTTGVGNHDGINNLPLDHPMILSILQWMADGGTLR
jgi:hypothetical protein